jgi:hypothetical protein
MRAGIVNWETHIYHILARHITGALRVPRFQGLPGEPKLADDELSDESLAAMAEEIAALPDDDDGASGSGSGSSDQE